MSTAELVVGLLLVAVLFSALAARLRVPYPIILAVVGLVLAAIPGLPTVRLDPDVILVLFLPPLIQSAALETSVQELRREAGAILLLAVGLVLATTALVALVARQVVSGLPWAAALVLGAVVSPPDAVAATQIAATVGLPPRLVTILSGEGLINDGTALTVYNLAVSAALTGGVTVLAVLGEFSYAVVVGIALGLAVTAVLRRLLRRLTDPVLENTLLLVLPFAAYLPAVALHASGVLAALTAGLVYVRRGSAEVSSAGRLQQRAFWSLLEFLLTALSFLLLGLQLRSILQDLGSAGAATLAGQAAAVCGTVIGLRLVWLPLSRLLVARGDGHAAGAMVAGWAGMRGVLTLATALAIPTAVPQRSLLVFLAFSVILVTLLGQGLTLAPFARRLGVVSTGDQDRVLALRAVQQTQARARSRLEELAPELPSTLVDRFREALDARELKLEQLMQAGDEDAQSVERDGNRSAQQEREQGQHLAAELLAVQQAELSRLVDDGLPQAVADSVRRVLDVRSLLPPI